MLGQTLVSRIKVIVTMKTPSMEEKILGYSARSLVTSSMGFTRLMETESTSSTDSDAACLSILHTLEI